LIKRLLKVLVYGKVEETKELDDSDKSYVVAETEGKELKFDSVRDMNNKVAQMKKEKKRKDNG